jgi:hypothetical protein
MLTRHDLAELSRAREQDMVLSVYLARQSSDPGGRGAWRLRLDGALDEIRSCIEREAPGDMPSFEKAAELVSSGLESYGRVLPSEGWSAFATEERLWHAEALPSPPLDAVRWRQGVYAAPYLRTLKASRPVILAVLTRMHATLYQYLDGALGAGRELHAEWPGAEAGDVGISKRAATTTGIRGVTRTDYKQRTVDENAKRLRKQVVEALAELAGDDGGVVLGGTVKAISAVRNDLEEKLEGRIVEAPEVSFDSSEAELSASVSTAASMLTRMRQARLLDACADAGGRASRGWNETYRALAAGAVDKLLVSRGLIETSPDDAERLVRLALAQGADVEELGEQLGERLMAEAEGVVARLRFKLLA